MAETATRQCGGCALHTVTYRHDIKVPGNEYMGTCRAPMWARLPTARWHDDTFAAKCPEFTEPGRVHCGPNFF